MKIRMSNGLTVFVVAVVAQGCMALPAPVTVNVPDAPDAPAQFEGLDAQLATNDVRILVVHGMSPHAPGYSNGLQALLKSELRLTVSHPCSQIDKWTDLYGDDSFIWECSYTRAAHTLDVFELTWSPLAHGLSDTIVGYDTKTGGVVPERVPLNGGLKAGLIDMAFTDAIIYSGSFAQTIRDATKRAICFVMTDHAPTAPTCPYVHGLAVPRRDVILLSHSLGSMIVFETLSEMTPTSQPARDFLASLSLVGMMANQLPLLSLARISDSTRGFKAFANLATTRKDLPIVAVSDPNDLLSYPLKSGWPAKLDSPARVINVSMPNATDFVLGAVNPYEAHVGYFTNSCVAKLFATGSPQCWVSPIAGLHYEDPGRVQTELGLLLRSEDAMSFPVFATVGTSAGGVGSGISWRNATTAYQVGPRILAAWGNPVGARRGDVLIGFGGRMSRWAITAGGDEFYDATAKMWKLRWSVGTGW